MEEAKSLINTEAIRLKKPKQRSFLNPNRATKRLKNRLTIDKVIKRRLSLSENKLRGMFNASVMATKYRLLLELQKPRQVKVVRKQSRMIIHL